MSLAMLGRTQQDGILPAALSCAIASSRRFTTDALPSMPLEHQSETANSRLPVASLKWQLLNLSGGEHQLLAGSRDRIDSRNEIGGPLIDGVPEEAYLVGNRRNCGGLYYRRAVHRRLQGQRLRLAPCFTSRQWRRNHDVLPIQPLPLVRIMGWSIATSVTARARKNPPAIAKRVRGSSPS